MDTRKLDHQEIVNIITGASDTIAKKLEDSSKILPKLIAAALEFYQLLANNEQIQQDDDKSRDIVKEMLIEEIKRMV